MLTVNQVADLLNVHHRTVRRWIKEGQLAAFKVGGSIRIAEESVNSAMRSTTNTAVEENN